MPPTNARAVAGLGDQALHGLEEVRVEAEQAVDPSQLRIGGPRGVAIVADERADDRAVLLFDVSAVVLAVGPAAGEHDALAPAVVVQRAIDELRAIVTVQPAQGNGQATADLMQRRLDACVALAPDGLQLDPARGDVDRAQGMQEEAAAVLATMRDEIDLEKAWPGVVPLGEGADGDLLLEPSARLRRAPTTAGRQPPRGGQQPFQGRGADLAHLGGRGRRHAELATGHQAVQQGRHEGLQPLGADLAGGLPQDLGDARHVSAVTPGPTDWAAHRAAAMQNAQRAQHRLPVIPGDRDDLSQQSAAVAASQLLIALALLRQVLPYARPRHGYPLRRGNRTSATHPSLPVTIILRRRGPLTWRRRTLRLPCQARDGPSQPRGYPGHRSARSLGLALWARRSIPSSRRSKSATFPVTRYASTRSGPNTATKRRATPA